MKPTAALSCFVAHLCVRRVILSAVVCCSVLCTHFMVGPKQAVHVRTMLKQAPGPCCKNKAARVSCHLFFHSKQQHHGKLQSQHKPTRACDSQPITQLCKCQLHNAS